MTSNLIRVGKLAGWLIFALSLLLLLILPLLTSLLVRFDRMPLGWTKYLSYVQSAQLYLISGLGAAWLFFLGSCFASFLNVVAWRVPRGRGINGSSMCPVCESKLRFSDNLPVYGWLRNRGRCRDCHNPISARYLIVELILGTIFLIVSSVEILAGGINLPLRPVDSLSGFEHLVFAPKWDLIQLAAYHLTLICLLFTFALIRSERLRVPTSVLVAGMVAGIGMPLIWPSMQLVDWQINNHQWSSIPRFSVDQWLTFLFGIVGGLACGLLLSWATRNPSVMRDDRDFQSTIEQRHSVDDAVAGMLLVGTFLGWQSAFSVALIMMVSLMVAQLFAAQRKRQTGNLPTWLLMATLIHLLGWRLLSKLHYWPGPMSPNWAMAGSAVVLIVVAWRLRMSNRRILSGQDAGQSPSSS